MHPSVEDSSEPAGHAAGKGGMTAEQYATQTVEVEVDGMLRMGEIWVEMRNQVGKAPKLDEYDGWFYLGR